MEFVWVLNVNEGGKFRYDLQDAYAKLETAQKRMTELARMFVACSSSEPIMSPTMCIIGEVVITIDATEIK